MEIYTDLEKKKNKGALYNWITRFNPYTETYMATTRDHYFELWDNIQSKSIISSSSSETLEEIIIINDGILSKVIEWKNKKF